ncbi:MAG: hypothetical protein JWQ90_3001 [Hydrocarboniphaga sp.]|uniref:LysM peptidoglycan-binding domain-containing protein n=1 Tax=Hydrocarboniphaga sp. TaxID=2033016 RepID=UPI002625EABD|nr:hypothetical protein [Hydrocarboniphaga sp.]MDB5970551.1 hypothetical protein [Hydrocarboniphaga sp.]
MSDAIQAFLQASGLQAQKFPANSRYANVGTTQMSKADGTLLSYLQRRFIPQPERYALLHEHVVVSGDRLDNLAARYFGDPELYWRICDANRAMSPDDLTEAIGRHLRITLQAGVPGVGDA